MNWMKELKMRVGGGRQYKMQENKTPGMCNLKSTDKKH